MWVARREILDDRFRVLLGRSLHADLHASAPILQKCRRGRAVGMGSIVRAQSCGLTPSPARGVNYTPRIRHLNAFHSLGVNPWMLHHVLLGGRVSVSFSFDYLYLLVT